MNDLVRNETLPASINVTVSMPGWLHHAMQQAGDVSATIQRALVPYLRAQSLLRQADADRFDLFWRLVDHVVLKAHEIARDGHFPESVTLDAIHRAMADDWWVTDYRDFVGGDIYRTGNPEKGRINREIGFRVKEALDAQVKKDANGKVMSVKVLGEIIQSYTPLLPR